MSVRSPTVNHVSVKKIFFLIFLGPNWTFHTAHYNQQKSELVFIFTVWPLILMFTQAGWRGSTEEWNQCCYVWWLGGLKISISYGSYEVA